MRSVPTTADDGDKLFLVSQRLVSLDALRGVAALVVLIQHSFLVLPAVYAPYSNPHVTGIGDLRWWTMYTPFHGLWDGSVAVMIFFVLSGFVLTLPYLGDRPLDLRSYFPARLVRLYLPVIVAVLFAAVLIEVMPTAEGWRVSPWVANKPTELTGEGVMQDMILLFHPGYTNSAFWSLKWEVIFSLLLPIVIFLCVRKFRGSTALAGAVITVSLIIGAVVGPTAQTTQMGAFYHLGTFALGSFIAVHWDRIRRYVAGLSTAIVGVAWAAALLLVSSYWLVYAFGDLPGQTRLVQAARVIQVFGAALVIVLVGSGRSAMRAEHPVFVWLGTRSFSLYLVHEPIVVAFGHLMGRAVVSPYFGILPGMICALVAAEIFFRLVERPSHLLSRKISKSITSRVRRTA